MTRPALVVVCLGASGGNEPRFDTDPVALPWHYQQHAEVTDHDRMHSRLVSETARVLDCTKTDAKTVLIVGKGGSPYTATRIAAAVRHWENELCTERLDNYPFIALVSKSWGAMAALEACWRMMESGDGPLIDLLVTIDAAGGYDREEVVFRKFLMTPLDVSRHWNVRQKNTQPHGWPKEMSTYSKLLTDPAVTHANCDEWVCAKPVFDGLTLAELIEKEWKG